LTPRYVYVFILLLEFKAILTIAKLVFLSAVRQVGLGCHRNTTCSMKNKPINRYTTIQRAEVVFMFILR
jgi:hypothetical protein